MSPVSMLWSAFWPPLLFFAIFGALVLLVTYIVGRFKGMK